jgi:hypothetical protein
MTALFPDDFELVNEINQGLTDRIRNERQIGKVSGTRFLYLEPIVAMVKEGAESLLPEPLLICGGALHRRLGFQQRFLVSTIIQDLARPWGPTYPGLYV